MYRAFGVDRILLANQLLDPNGLAWLADELNADPEFWFGCFVDSVRGAHLMAEALARHGASRPVDVLVELANDGARTGARTLAEASEVADAVLRNPMLRLVGVGGYEGAVAHDVSEQALSAVDGYLRRLRKLVAELAESGHFSGLDEVLVTCGGSAYFDQVAEAFTEPWPTGLPVVPVLRSGGYLLHDDGFYLIDLVRTFF
ncbi:D-serine deaminase-like pyridoxal phosphate-dependent protein [Saccharopolyspora phatthalungensis]|uniref:D-serine deaminase-like pyridoxal phosphate-dependent protein n=1 Tax=Saccharopolyspora phatthalungensis TaxID=664693 RepID=A0A840Q7I4_9PSEU|nr:D-serine deaminase-like pyridoxal phosphate-dependent protein [Saccharopolyspora phatthalungensis]